MGEMGLVDLYRQYGFWRTAALLAGCILFIAPLVALDGWLSGKTGWREAYGFSCHRKCMFEDMYYSPRLLAHHTGYEIGLFALIWFLPAVFALSLAIILLRRRLTSSRNRIRPMDG
ncbi:hypothetical protein [Novosphingobium sp. 9]|uniref:hypothetical protein n=1 Tax=Novosphingobium sp. 9 TaxID=2025349 RepID=UPI0021B5B669|nr:hypothetical protein [Novosphingobium sp. 9]